MTGYYRALIEELQTTTWPGLGTNNRLIREAARFHRWLAQHDAEVAAKAWDEGARSRQCHCEAWSDGECACGNYPSEANPYRKEQGDD